MRKYECGGGEVGFVKDCRSERPYINAPGNGSDAQPLGTGLVDHRNHPSWLRITATVALLTT